MIGYQFNQINQLSDVTTDEQGRITSMKFVDKNTQTSKGIEARLTALEKKEAINRSYRHLHKTGQ